MPDRTRPSLFTLPFGQDLCDATVDAILKRAGDDPLALSEALLLLPNNRAIRSMTEAFVRRIKPGLLLPRMAAVGDLALDEALGPLVDPLSSDAAILPVIEPLERLLLLSGLIARHRAVGATKVTPTEALRLARYLAGVIDELEIEQIKFERFDIIKPEGHDLAGHWQSSYAQLLAMIPEYDAALAKMERIGPSARRNLLLDQLSRSLTANPPAGLVVAAGISTAAPAIAKLLKRVAVLPNSMAILPSIDLQMEDTDWAGLGPHEQVDGELMTPRSHESHPQYHLKLLLDRMGFRREEVEMLSTKAGAASEVIPQVFCVPDATAAWQNLKPSLKKLPHVSLMVAEDSAEEARAIAIMVRGALETEGKRIAIVTPDRELALRVAAQLKRWDIAVDDSAGTALAQSPEAMLVLALAEALAHGFAPVQLLAVIKHPLVHKGDARIAWLEQARHLDILLRGPNEGFGLSAIDNKIGATANEELQLWWQELRPILEALEIPENCSFSDVSKKLHIAATALSQEAVWKGATGRQLAGFFEDIGRHDLSAIGKVQAAAIPSILAELLDGQVVRPAYGGHPRVAIYGLLEARLQQADMLVCAGLNEGSWPQLQTPDPWLAPRIRRDLKLPGPERNIGLSAHDLATALGAREVVLTRAKRDQGGPTVASRFLLRIQALLGSALRTDEDALLLARQIDAPSAPIRVGRPAPMPTSEQRLVPISITQFDTLKANPYSFYASKIMRLGELEAVDAEPSYAWRGTVIHRILEHWHKEDDSAPEALIKRAEDLLSNNALHPALRAMWQPRIAKSLRWIAEETQRLRDEENRVVLVAEKRGEMEIAGVKVSGTPDRIDRLADDSLAIVDYKTGGAPSAAQISAGFALQLGLLGLMAEQGKIAGVKGTASQFEYWSLAKDKGEFGALKKPTSDKEKKNTILTTELVDFAEKEAIETLNKWINGNEPFTAMLEPKYAYGEHDQLMRLQEWDGREKLRDGDGA